MQDNDPAHKEAPQLVRAYNTRNICAIQLLLKWPPNSPDLNPIENLWSWIQAEANEKACNTLAEYKQAVQDLLKAVPKSMVHNMINNMPKRIAEVIKLKGEKINY